MLREAHGRHAIDAHGQNGDERVHEREPVGEEGPAGKASAEAPSPTWGARAHLEPCSPRGLPVVVHVLDLAFDIAVDSLAVSTVG